MKVKRISILMTVVLVAIFVTTLPIGHLTADAVGKTFRLKIQSAYPRGDLSMELLKDFAQTANKLSKGQIRIQVFADPELVPAEQLFEATQKGNPGYAARCRSHVGGHCRGRRSGIWSTLCI